jgi:hypothetical protein
MVVWANCHGGFLAGLVIIATALVGGLVSGPLDAERRARLGGLSLVFALCVAATFGTPYGTDLHRHVAKLLFTSRVTDLIDEYQPMPFGKGTARIFEWIVLGLIALPSLTGRRIARYDLLQCLVWLHLALTSIRHAPIFAFAAAPPVAALIDASLTHRDRPPSEHQPRPSRPSFPLFATAASIFLVGLVSLGWRPARLDPARWPVESIEVVRKLPLDASLFHEQDWGGLIELEDPARRSFIDDRFELFGRREIEEYVRALEGGPGWDRLDNQRRFAVVWVRPTRGLAERLAADPAWRELARDDVAVVFVRKGGSTMERGGGSR